jgi:arylsulfatase A-like enzyme
MSKRPNFLFFCVDQMQAECLGCAGHPDVRTPNLDRLAARGVRFERATCENPICTPSRISILTGLSSRQHGILGNGRLLRHTVPTFASVLRRAGYRTQACGKMHLQPWSQERSLRNSGVDRRGLPHSWEDRLLWQEGTIKAVPEGYFGFEACDLVTGHVDYAGGDYLHWLEREHPDWAVPIENTSRVDWRDPFPDKIEHPGHIGSCFRLKMPAEIHYNTWIADRSGDFLRAQKGDDPFLLWCSFPDPHHPFAAAGVYNDMYDPEVLRLPDTWDQYVDADCGLDAIPHHMHGFRHEAFNEAGLRHILAQTYGMISHVDDCVGKVLTALQESGHADDTVVVFLADHGEYLGSHHLLAKGNFLFEELMRVPLIWCDPQTSQKGTVASERVSLLDLAPTILDRVGISMENLWPEVHIPQRAPYPCFDGRSLNPRIRDGKALEPRDFLASRDDHFAAWSPEYRPGLLRLRCFYRDDWKLVVSNQGDIQALYHLGEDPHECRDRWNDPACAATLSELLSACRLHCLDREWIGHGRVGSA